MANVRITNATKSYGADQVIHGVDLDISDGEFVVFVGPSGCGKSTLLRMIAGLEEISGGEIEIGGRVMNEVAPAKRGVAMVFQTYALYPHMTVFNNMAFGLKQARTAPAEIDARVRAAAEVLKITDYLDRLPRALSGGQRQRVAIGRAIVREPEVFLFDEPLSNLDAALRVQTRLEIARLHQRLDATMIYVTHDQVEAMTLADKIVVLRGGRIEQTGAPIDLYERPTNTFVAGFIGSPQMNFFTPADLAPSAPEGLGGEAMIGIRPEHLRVCGAEDALLTARLELVEQLGEYALAHMVCESGAEFIAKMEAAPAGAKGSRLGFTADLARIHRFDARGIRRGAQV
ncbi:MAG: sn-glycerol-3-phosphate ABC transporter ATP-binding protein UgpC [Pseudomonadota bacterium]